MHSEHEDAAPCVPVELSQERPDTLPPDTEREPTLGDVMAAIALVKTEIEIRSIEAHFRFGQLEKLVNQTALWLDEQTKQGMYDLDRRIDQHLTKIAGHVDSLATIVHVHSHSLDRAHQRLDGLEPDQDQHAHNGNGNGNGNGAD